MGIPPFYPAACKEHLLFLKQREHPNSSGGGSGDFSEEAAKDNNLIYVLLLFRYDLLVRKYSEFCLPCICPVSLSPRPLYGTIQSLPVQPGCGAAPLSCTTEYPAKPTVYFVFVCTSHLLLSKFN